MKEKPDSQIFEEHINSVWISPNSSHIKNDYMKFCKVARQVIEKLGMNCPKCDSCCCKSCYGSQGYFSHMETQLFIELKEEILKCGKLFKKDVGFLTPKGCSLPKNLRSWTCLTHSIKPSDSGRCYNKKYTIFAYHLDGIFSKTMNNFRTNKYHTFQSGIIEIERLLVMMKDAGV